MRFLFNELLYKPLLNTLVWLYETVAFNDLGIAIILLTIIIRFILFPLFYKSFKNQTLLQRLQPKIKKIQKEHKKNREAQAQALMELYKTHKVNPFAGIGLLLIQLPILIALYRVFLNDFTRESIIGNLYSFIEAPAAINDIFLGLIPLQDRSMIIVALAVGAQYIQGKLSVPQKVEGNEMASKVGRQMMYIGPILTLIILPSLPAAVGLYWLTSSIFSAAQQQVINKNIKKETDGRIPEPNKETNSPNWPK
jgi:YidC/Oxa1 family membrane protein insertase